VVVLKLRPQVVMVPVMIPMAHLAGPVVASAIALAVAGTTLMVPLVALVEV